MDLSSTVRQAFCGGKTKEKGRKGVSRSITAQSPATATANEIAKVSLQSIPLLA